MWQMSCPDFKPSTRQVGKSLPIVACEHHTIGKVVEWANLGADLTSEHNLKLDQESLVSSCQASITSDHWQKDKEQKLVE